MIGGSSIIDNLFVRERNRILARNTRLRNKLHVEEMKHQIVELTAKNLELSRRIEMLEGGTG